RRATGAPDLDAERAQREARARTFSAGALDARGLRPDLWCAAVEACDSIADSESARGKTAAERNPAGPNRTRFGQRRHDGVQDQRGLCNRVNIADFRLAIGNKRST